MRVLLIFALVLLAANAFNLTAYHAGAISYLGFTSDQYKYGLICVNALEQDYVQVSDLLMSGNMDNITQNIGALIIQVQKTFISVCRPFWNAQMVSQKSNMSELIPTIKSDIKLDYLGLIEGVAQWYYTLEEGDDYYAGQLMTHTILSLVNIEIANDDIEPKVVFPKTPVPFNATKFFSEYYGGLYEALGLSATPNVSAFIECSANLQNVTLAVIYARDNFAKYNFEEKLNTVEYLINLGFDTVRNCEGIADTEKVVMGPILKAFSQDPIHFTLKVVKNVLNDLTEFVWTVETEVSQIEAGGYSNAGFSTASAMQLAYRGLLNGENGEDIGE